MSDSPKPFIADASDLILDDLAEAAKKVYADSLISDPDVVPITVKDITRIDLKPDEILAIGLPEGTTSEDAARIAQAIRHSYAKDKERGINRNIMVYVGDWKLHVIKAQEAKEVIEFNKELRSL